MNTKLFLLFGTSLSLIPNLTLAQCVATQDCATLGYTETSCPSGKGVKCPFGNKWACLPTKETICKEEGFTLACNGTGQIGSGDSCNGLYKKCSCDSTYKYTCSGTGYSGGSGTACGGKYTACTCTSGYTWKEDSCQIYNGEAIGDLYYCNGKVVGVKAGDMNFYVAMEDLYMELLQPSSYDSYRTFCGNARGIVPSRDQLRLIYKNILQINALLSTNGGSAMTRNWYWSSTSYREIAGGGDITSYCIVNMSDGSYRWEYGFSKHLGRLVLASY